MPVPPELGVEVDDVALFARVCMGGDKLIQVSSKVVEVGELIIYMGILHSCATLLLTKGTVALTWPGVTSEGRGPWLA